MAKEGWYGFIAVATKVDDNNCRQFFVNFFVGVFVCICLDFKLYLTLILLLLLLMMLMLLFL